MKAFKHMTAFVLALVMAAALAVTAYAASVTVKYRVYVYSDEITFRQYDYSQSTTPSITNLTISATSSLGSGSALYHMKYADGAVAYCIEPGVHSDDSGTYKEGSSASWYNLPASVQSGIALAMSLGYTAICCLCQPGLKAIYSFSLSDFIRRRRTLPRVSGLSFLKTGSTTNDRLPM